MASFGQFDQIGPLTNAIGGGWKLYHYVVGTTTTKDLWSDRDKQTTVAQPLQADANGVVSFYGDGLYDFVVKDANGVLLYTWEKVFYGSIESTNHAEGVALSSASTLILGADGDYFHVTGTTTINAMQGTQPFVWLTFDSALTLTHSSSFVLKGAVNHPVSAGETLVFVNDGTNVFREVDNSVPMRYMSNTWTGPQTFNNSTTFAGDATFNSTIAVPTPTSPLHAATKAMAENRAVEATALSNGYVDVSTPGDNTMTVSLLTQAGTAPTADDVISVGFRAGTQSNSSINVRAVSSAATLTISAGSTLGFSTSQISRLYVVALDNAGVVELGVYHPLSGTTHAPLDETLFYSTTAEGGAGGADSAQVIYSTSARSTVPIAVLGYIDIQTGATAGNWSNAPIQVQVITTSTPLSGSVIQRVFTNSTAIVTTATTMPYDDTIPQNNEGEEMLTRAITPKHAANLLMIAHVGVYTGTTASSGTVALFQDSTANALAAVSVDVRSSNASATASLFYLVQAGSTSSTTFKIRAGSSSGSYAMNGQASGATRLYGGVCYSGLMVMEIFL